MDRRNDIEHGLALVRRLSELMPDQAQGEISRVYDETRQTLRVPFVNFVFRILARYPDYLVPAWDGLRPWARARLFESEADRLRAAAAPGADVAGADWAALGDLQQIRAFTDSIHYALPKLLLLATAMDEGLEQSAGPGDESQTAGEEIPSGIAAGTLALPMISPDEAAPDIREIFEKITTRHGHPGVATYYRSLAQWPDFLKAAWARIEPSLGTVEREARKGMVLHQALEAATQAKAKLPRAPEAKDELRAMLAVFRFRVIPDLLLDVALVKTMIDGAEAARHSRFSAA